MEMDRRAKVPRCQGAKVPRCQDAKATMYLGEISALQIIKNSIINSN